MPSIAAPVAACRSRSDAVAAKGRLEQVEGLAGARRERLADLDARLARQDAPGTFREKYPVNGGELRGHDPLLRVVRAGLGGDGVTERLLGQVGDLPAPAGERVAAAAHPGERRGGHAEGDVALGDPLGVVTADRREQALTGSAPGDGAGQAADDLLG